MTTNLTGFPLAYLITFRTYGTWLHGDGRGSVDRHQNTYGTPRLPPRPEWQLHASEMLARPPVTLDARQRGVVREAVRECCALRGWRLVELNVRTNHVHTVVSASCDPHRILGAFKANATRHLREAGCWSDDRGPWSRGGSKRYLWTEGSVAAAVRYVRDGQGGPLPEL